MTKKERTIRACRELAAKYREPERKLFFIWEGCPLCYLHKPGKAPVENCRGCPLASAKGTFGAGCFGFNTTKKAMKLVGQGHIGLRDESVIVQKAFNARAAFFDKIIPILEKIPAKRFTKKGWEYFNELSRSW